MTDSTPRGSLTTDQVVQLLHPVNPSRVVRGDHVKPHLSQQDVLAHLTRVFGFGHFDIEVRETECIFEQPTTNSRGAGAWSVGYRALVRLWVRDPDQKLVAYFDGGSTGESEGQPSRAASHDLAYKSALSTSLKRATIALGDQFGLSLYNKGQMTALVKGVMVGGPVRQDGDVQEGVDQQEVDGGTAGELTEAEGSQEPAEPSAKPVATKRATNGRQGTKRAPAKAAEPQAERVEIPAEATAPAEPEKPAAEPEAPAATAPVVDLNRARAQDALPGETEPEYQMRKRSERAAAEAMEREQRKVEEQAAIDVAEDEERAERQRQAAAQEAKIREEEAAAAAEVERIKAERAQRGAPVKATPEEATAIVKAEPEPWAEPAVGAEPDWRAMTLADWSTHAEGLKNIVQVKASWDAASAANALTTEARMELIKRKARIESAAKPAAEPEQSTLA